MTFARHLQNDAKNVKNCGSCFPLKIAILLYNWRSVHNSNTIFVLTSAKPSINIKPVKINCPLNSSPSGIRLLCIIVIREHLLPCARP